jgi:type I restriction-modification system DNA methylase subunit
MAQFLQLLKPGGRAAVIVPDGVPPSVRKVVRSIRPTTWGLNRRP